MECHSHKVLSIYLRRGSKWGQGVNTTFEVWSKAFWSNLATPQEHTEESREIFGGGHGVKEDIQLVKSLDLSHGQINSAYGSAFTGSTHTHTAFFQRHTSANISVLLQDLNNISTTNLLDLAAKKANGRFE